MLSEAEERILNLKSLTSYFNWVKMTSGFLSKEERKVLSEEGKKSLKTFSEIMSLMNSKTRKVRDSSAKAFHHIMNTHVEVAEAELNSILGNKKVDDDLRKMDRPDLGRHVSDDIESEIVDSLLDTVSARFSLSSQYYGLKAKLME